MGKAKTKSPKKAKTKSPKKATTKSPKKATMKSPKKATMKSLKKATMKSQHQRQRQRQRQHQLRPRRFLPLPSGSQTRSAKWYIRRGQTWTMAPPARISAWHTPLPTTTPKISAVPTTARKTSARFRMMVTLTRKPIHGGRSVTGHIRQQRYLSFFSLLKIKQST